MTEKTGKLSAPSKVVRCLIPGLVVPNVHGNNQLVLDVAACLVVPFHRTAGMSNRTNLKGMTDKCLGIGASNTADHQARDFAIVRGILSHSQVQRIVRVHGTQITVNVRKLEFAPRFWVLSCRERKRDQCVQR
jgi:hypothetical protein